MRSPGKTVAQARKAKRVIRVNVAWMVLSFILPAFGLQTNGTHEIMIQCLMSCGLIARTAHIICLLRKVRKVDSRARMPGLHIGKK